MLEAGTMFGLLDRRTGSPMHIFQRLGDRFDVSAWCHAAERSAEKRERQDAAGREKPKNV